MLALEEEENLKVKYKNNVNVTIFCIHVPLFEMCAEIIISNMVLTILKWRMT
jgi:uncharacterized membrane protein YGL010W